MARATVCGLSWLSSTLTWLCCPSCHAVFNSRAIRACWASRACSNSPRCCCRDDSSSSLAAMARSLAVVSRCRLPNCTSALRSSCWMLFWRSLSAEISRLMRFISACSFSSLPRVSCSSGSPRTAPAVPASNSTRISRRCTLVRDASQVGPGHFRRLRQAHHGQ